MDALFWISQVGWVAFLACGAYVSFCFADLADEDAARTATPLHAMPSRPGQNATPNFSPPARGGVLG